MYFVRYLWTVRVMGVDHERNGRTATGCTPFSAYDRTRHQPRDNSFSNWKRFCFGVNWRWRLATVYLCLINILTYLLTYFSRRFSLADWLAVGCGIESALAARHPQSPSGRISHLSGNRWEALHCAESLSSSPSSGRNTSCRLRVVSRRLRHRVTQLHCRSDAAVHCQVSLRSLPSNRLHPGLPDCHVPLLTSQIGHFLQVASEWRLFFGRLKFFWYR